MRSEPLIVLKFGGSVLLDEDRLRVAVHEIYRWRREGWRVVAVVSALAGTTDALLEKCARLNDRPDALFKAGIVAAGELESAGLLGLHLDRAGVPASVLTPAVVRLLAQGDALDAEPHSVDASFINATLERDEVVVVPGFVAVDPQGRTVTLGRGGSDLTALFLAHALNAKRCRLIKDVDGLYEHDPADPSFPEPRRYARISYTDALSLDGSIIQHKAVRFAADHQIRFELGRFNGTKPTQIGNHESQLTEECDESTRLSVALLGFGTVGGGVFDLVYQLPDLFCITGIAARDTTKHARADPRASQPGLTNDPIELAGCGADIVVEVMGGQEPAHSAVERALANGSHIITANKSLMAEYGDELRRVAVEHRKQLLCSASVGGSTPVLERLRAISSRIRAVRGVLNGSSNFIFEQMRRGLEFQEAVARARQLGLAEADPSRDLHGLDCADKLRVIRQALRPARYTSEPVELIDQIDENTVAEATDRANGGRLRQIGSLSNFGDASVRLTRVERDDPLHDVRDEWNAVEIQHDDSESPIILRGKGAGRWPTAEAVLGDLLEISRLESENRSTTAHREARVEGTNSSRYESRELVAYGE